MVYVPPRLSSSFEIVIECNRTYATEPTILFSSRRKLVAIFLCSRPHCKLASIYFLKSSSVDEILSNSASATPAASQMQESFLTRPETFNYHLLAIRERRYIRQPYRSLELWRPWRPENSLGSYSALAFSEIYLYHSYCFKFDEHFSCTLSRWVSFDALHFYLWSASQSILFGCGLAMLDL